MENLKVFENTQFGEVRILIIDGEPWFVGMDIATMLGFQNSRDAIDTHVDEDDKQILKFGEASEFDVPNRGFTIINESGVYSLIFGSELPSAKVFKRWITHDVLPQIRREGYYISNDLDALKRLVLRSVNERYKRAAIIDAIRISDVSIPRFVSELVSNPDIMDVRRLTSADKREDVYRPEHRQIFTLSDMIKTYPHDIGEVKMESVTAHLAMQAERTGKKRSKQITRTFNEYYISMQGMIDIATDMANGRFQHLGSISETTRDVWIENIHAYCEPWIAECEALEKPDYFLGGYNHANMEQTTVELKKLAEASREAIEAGKDESHDLTVKG